MRRSFTAVAPDVLWCGDVTQIDTDEGPLYLATVEDLFSGRMLGHAMSEHHNAALRAALKRRPSLPFLPSGRLHRAALPCMVVGKPVQ